MVWASKSAGAVPKGLMNPFIFTGIPLTFRADTLRFGAGDTV
jgi:hypothetical protein